MLCTQPWEEVDQRGDATGTLGSTGTVRLKHDLMHEGIDWDHVLKYEEKIQELKKKALVPMDYTVHAPIQLIPERVIDTTNRSLVFEAQRDGFDPDGFKNGNPLQKDLFYLNPYITCSWCNAMNYVDVLQVRRMISLPEEVKHQISGESLPACEGCGRADGFQVGASDFMDLIQQRKREEEERRLRVLNSTITLQRMYRAHLRYMFGYAYNRKMKAKAKLIHRAASQIQAICRVRLARRIFATEKRLVIIRNAHPRLLARALEKKPGLRNTFWYKTPLEIKLLYEDYVNLCSRTGFQPPRLLVEKNIAELAKRILSRQNELITMIQKRWRGLMTRRIIKLYAIERIRLRQWSVSFLLRIQRCYRGHCCRLHLPERRERDWREKMKERYLQERQGKRRETERQRERERVKLLYQKERRDEFSCRVLNRIDDDPTPYPHPSASASVSLLSQGQGRQGEEGSLSRSATEDSQSQSLLLDSNLWYRNEYSQVREDEEEEEEQQGQQGKRQRGGQSTASQSSHSRDRDRDRERGRGGDKGGVMSKPKGKMTLFSQSCYSSDHFKETLGRYLEEERGVMATENQQRREQRERKEFMLQRIAEHGPRGYGRRGYAHSQKGTHALPDHLNHKIFLLSTPKTSPFFSSSSGSVRKRGVGIGKTPKKAIASVEPVEYRVRPSSRSQGMSCYHLQELNEIVTEEISRSTHEFKKVDLKEKIQIFNQQTATPAVLSGAGAGAGAGSRLKKGKRVLGKDSGSQSQGKAVVAKYKYKYPADVNCDPLQWLYDDIDTTIQFQDSQMKLNRAPSSYGGATG